MKNMSSLQRINLAGEDGEAKSNEGQFRNLSTAGQIFLDFLRDGHVAVGNDPRAVIRSQLLRLFSEDLVATTDSDEKYMEDDHGYIQWLFPITTKGVNPRAPVLRADDHRILAQDWDVRNRMYEHFKLFISFMGVSYAPERGTFTKVNAKQWGSWIKNSHNYLRITRILISLSSFGLQQVAADFVKFLEAESYRTKADLVGDQYFVAFNEETRVSCLHFWIPSVRTQE